jgi:hypothetical protein
MAGTEVAPSVERVVEVERLSWRYEAATAGAERLPGVDEPLDSSAFLLVFPAIATPSRSTLSHLPKNAR